MGCFELDDLVFERLGWLVVVLRDHVDREFQ
jgi:hypothetical protein